MLTGELAIVSESSLLLYQREFLKGDVVKRSLVAVESAVVVRVKTEVQLEHVASCTRPRGWVPYEKLRNALYIEARDKVVYDEWVGTVEEVSTDDSLGGIGRSSDWLRYSRMASWRLLMIMRIE
jgi:ubiquitin-conjugating enzyme E2 O